MQSKMDVHFSSNFGWYSIGGEGVGGGGGGSGGFYLIK